MNIQFHIPRYRRINRTFAADVAAAGFLINSIFSVDPAQYSTRLYILDKNIEKYSSTRTRVIAIFRYRHRNVRCSKPAFSVMWLFLERCRSSLSNAREYLISRFNLTRELVDPPGNDYRVLSLISPRLLQLPRRSRLLRYDGNY